MWLFFLIAAFLCLCGSVCLSIIGSNPKYKAVKIMNPFNFLFGGVAVSAGFLFIPIHIYALQGTDCGLLELVFSVAYSTVKLFLVDGDFEFILENAGHLSGFVYRGYTILFSALFVVAPVLTFGFVLSFFKNLSAYKRYISHYRADVYVFSEVNQKSVALAKSLNQNKKEKRIFVFADVFDTDEEEFCEWLEEIKQMGGICFRKDITNIWYACHSQNASLHFFAIGQDQTENISQSLRLVELFGHRPNTNLYVFSTQTGAELLLTNAFKQEDERNKPRQIRVRRVNSVESLIARNLYETGFTNIFEGARKTQTGEKEINAVVVGMGKYGTEMVKSLSWFCQMDGYLPRIDAFDADPNAEERFRSLCPELMDFSGVIHIPGETKYTLNIHSGVDVDSASFDKTLATLPAATYVFVSLGDDERNVAVAVKLRALYERLGVSPAIQAVVYNSDKRKSLVGVKNFKGQEYAIDFIGDWESCYTEKVILNSKLEEVALQRHLKWGDERDFWQFDYNRKSSVASAIHREMKRLCHIPGIEKEPTLRTPEEREAIRVLEHCRWNAYMRSEGYVYGEKRNDLAQTHNCLVPFKELSLKEQEKDDD